MATIDLGRVVGKSAYEIAVEHGFEGTEQEWIDSLNYDDDIYALDEKINQEIEDRTNADNEIKDLITSTVDLAIANVVNDAPEDFDTLKEMSDWISEHSEDAAAMNSAILENKNAIAKKADISHTHDDRYYTETEIDTKLNNKVDKVSGKGLSTNDFTTAEKNKLAGLSNYDDTTLKTLINDKADKSHTHSNKTNYVSTTMVSLGFTVGSFVSVRDFWSKLCEKVGSNGVVQFEWADANRALIGTETNSLALNGGTLIYTANRAPSTWANFSAIYYQGGSGNHVYHIKCQIGDDATVGKEVWSITRVVKSVELNNYATKTELNSHTHDELTATGLPSGTDLNSVNLLNYDCKEFYSVNGGTYKNAPSNNFTLRLIETENGGCIQLFCSHQNSTVKLYSRAHLRVVDNYYWTEWSSLANIDEIEKKYATKTELSNIDGLKKHTKIDLISKSTDNFYPVIITGRTRTAFKEVMITSAGGNASVAYNQNRIHFTISNEGWNDTPKSLFIQEYACYDKKEITIGCIGYGNKGSQNACVWLRGGRTYDVFTMDCYVSSTGADVIENANDSNYSKFTVGTNYYGGTNTNVEILFTPQTTITNGLYSSRAITAPNFIGLASKATADASGNNIETTYATKAELEEIKKKNDELAEENEGLYEYIGTLENNNNNLLTRIDMLQRENQMLSNDVSTLTSEKMALQTENLNLQSQITSLNIEIQNLNNYIRQLEDQIRWG